jgi:hypothetical protein
MLNISIIGFGDQMKDAAANLPVLGFSKVDMILKETREREASVPNFCRA